MYTRRFLIENFLRRLEKILIMSTSYSCLHYRILQWSWYFILVTLLLRSFCAYMLKDNFLRSYFEYCRIPRWFYALYTGVHIAFISYMPEKTSVRFTKFVYTIYGILLSNFSEFSHYFIRTYDLHIIHTQHGNVFKILLRNGGPNNIVFKLIT